MLGKALWHWLRVGGREPSPITPSGGGHRSGLLGHLQRDRGITAGALAMPWALQHPAPRRRCTDSCSGGLGSPPSFILKRELKATPEQPALKPGGLSPRGGRLLGGPCPGHIAAHRLQLGGHQHPELPANQRDISALLPPYLSKRQHPSGPFEEPPVSPICSVRHFCAWEKKNKYICSWESGSPDRRRQPPPCPIQPLPLPCCLLGRRSSTGSLGVV